MVVFVGGWVGDLVVYDVCNQCYQIIVGFVVVMEVFDWQIWVDVGQWVGVVF